MLSVALRGLRIPRLLCHAISRKACVWERAGLLQPGKGPRNALAARSPNTCKAAVSFLDADPSPETRLQSQQSSASFSLPPLRLSPHSQARAWGVRGRCPLWKGGEGPAESWGGHWSRGQGLWDPEAAPLLPGLRHPGSFLLSLLNPTLPI